VNDQVEAQEKTRLIKQRYIRCVHKRDSDASQSSCLLHIFYVVCFGPANAQVLNCHTIAPIGVILMRVTAVGYSLLII